MEQVTNLCLLLLPYQRTKLRSILILSKICSVVFRDTLSERVCEMMERKYRNNYVAKDCKLLNEIKVTGMWHRLVDVTPKVRVGWTTYILSVFFHVFERLYFPHLFVFMWWCYTTLIMDFSAVEDNEKSYYNVSGSHIVLF